MDTEVEVEVEVTVLVPPVSVDTEVTVLVPPVKVEVAVTVEAPPVPVTVETAVTVEVDALDDERKYAPPAATIATTITMAATVPVPMALLMLNFIFDGHHFLADLWCAEIFYCSI